MDKISEVFNTYRNPIYIGAAVIIILLALYFVSKRTVGLQSAPVAPQGVFDGSPEIQESFKTGTKGPVKVIVFFAPWCPHCKHMMEGDDSLWSKLKRKHGDKKDLEIEQVNCDEQPELATKFGIKGFPTIVKMKQDKIETFEGDRTLEALEGFIFSD